LLPMLEGHPVDLREVLPYNERQTAFTRYDASTRRLEVVSMDPRARDVLRFLADHGSEFPAAAKDALLSRIEPLSRVLPARPRAAMRARRGEAGGRRRLRSGRATNRLELSIEARLQPLQGVPSLLPGDGPRELIALESGELVHVVRDPIDEIANAR